MPTHNALLAMLQQQMPRARNALADLATKPWPYTDPRAFAAGMGTAPSEEAAQIGSGLIPVAGDALGLAQDIGGYLSNPDTLTPKSALWSMAAMLPMIPREARNYDKAKDLAKALQSEVEAATGVMPDISLSFRTPDTLRLDRIVVTPSQRGRGAGSDAMRKLTEYADQHGLNLVLNASGDFGGSKAGQRRLYKRFGFQDYKKTADLPEGAVSMFDDGLMYRKPSVSPK